MSLPTPEPTVGEPDPTVLTRRNLRHALIRRRNERVTAGGDDSYGDAVELFMAPLTREELLVDGDPAEAQCMDFLGETFCGIPLTEDGRLARGAFVVRWLRDLPGAAAAATSDGHAGEEPTGV